MQLQHHSVIESCRLTHRRNDIIAYLTNLTHMAHIHPTSGIPPICVSVPVGVFCCWGIATHRYIPLPPDPWFSGKWVNGSLLSEKGKAWSIRGHFLQKGAFMKQLAPIKVAFFSPTWTATHKKLSHLLQHYEKVMKKKPWKAQGSAERWWFIGGFLDLLCGLCLLSRKNHPRSWSSRYIQTWIQFMLMFQCQVFG